MSLQRSSLRYFNEESKKYAYRVTLEGKVCPHYFHDTYLSRRHIAYAVMLQDLSNAKSAFLELQACRITLLLG
jgi:hypothetical protein